MTTGPRTEMVSVEELEELRKIARAQAGKKANSKAKSAARGELIKRHKSEFDGLIVQFKANPKSS